VSNWLITEGANVNALDRFKRTPLEDSIRGDFKEVAKLLVDNGGKVYEDGELVDLASSRMAGVFGYVPSTAFEFEEDWELDPNSLTIMEKLGEGEFGVVHKASWHGTLVAAKILKGSSDIALEDFRGEIEILRRVHHPNAVQFLGACTKREPYILVTELMSGGSLADALRNPSVFTLRRAVEVALDAARGLAYLHNHKPSPIIHRDLKPGNLMFSGSQYQNQYQIQFDVGTIKMADFGLSKTLPVNKHADVQENLDSKFRLTGETGSYRYMAPEVFRHEPYNYRVDIYSYAMIIYQLVEYKPPFAGMDPIEAARQAALYQLRPQFYSLLQPLPVKRALKELIEKCWAADPDERPDFEAIVVQLELVMAKLPRMGLSGEAPGCSCTVS
jgi:serine/threonine protein kinase